MESGTFKYEGERNDYLLHYEHVFGNAFERGGKSVLWSVGETLCRKLKGEQVITLQMEQQLKARNINVMQAQLLCCHFKAKEAEACKVQFNCLEDSESDSYD